MPKRIIFILAMVFLSINSIYATIYLDAWTDKDVYCLGEPITVYIYGSGFPSHLQFSTDCQVDYIMDWTYDSGFPYCLTIVTYADLPKTWTKEHNLASYAPGVGYHSITPYMHDWSYSSSTCYFEVIAYYDGDINESGRVDFADYSRLANAWKSTPFDSNWDTSCNLAEPDDIIDEYDLEVLIDNWLMGY